MTHKMLVEMLKLLHSLSNHNQMRQLTIALMGLLIGSLLFIAHELSEEGFKVLESMPTPTIPTPRYTMNYNMVELENDSIAYNEGHIVAYDTVVVISRVGYLKGKWVAPDIFETRTKQIVFNEESVVVHSNVLAATGQTHMTDTYVRSE